MKKLFFTLLTSFCLFGCNGESYEPTSFTAQEIRYEKAFVSKYGKLDPKHTWGFDIAATRVASPNANQWGEWIKVPEPLTDEQKQVVTEWFSTHRNPNGIAVHWSDYFAQQVSSTSHGQHMDAVYDTADHIFNFNAGDCSYNGSVKYMDGHTGGDKIQLMIDQSTEHFSYHETVSDKTWLDHYVIIPGDVIDPTNAYGLHGMYFLGFDYESDKDDSDADDVPRDYYFNDWIIKITPGMYYGNETHRVFAEDLSVTTGDFDFNDVVFDVTYRGYYDNMGQLHSSTVITLLASGGTLPIYVKGVETHAAFDMPTSTPVNTWENKTKAPVVIWRIPGQVSPADVDITVYDVTLREIRNVEGHAPGKICVPCIVEWTDENESIEVKYPKFNDWVNDESKKFWE